MNKFVNVLVAAAVAATGALFAPTAQAAPKQQEVCYDISYVHEQRWSKEVPGEKEVSHQEYKYKRQVPKFKTVYQWEKWVKGTKEKRGYHGQWIPDGNFDWRDFPNAGPVWADGGSGPHHSTWTENNVRYTSTEFKYVKTGVTKEEPDGTKTEYTEWVKSKPEGEGWTKIDERTVVDTEAVPGYTLYYVPGGDHTRTLGESNWTTDTPEGWTFVDERKREVKNEVPCVNPPKRITKRFQVDTYSNPSTKLANKAAGYDNDGKLKWGEDRPHYGHSRWQIVNVVGYDNWTKAQWTAAINKATTRSGVGNVTSTHHVGKVKKGQKLTVAWEIKKDSWPNKGKRGAQTFFARGLK